MSWRRRRKKAPKPTPPTAIATRDQVLAGPKFNRKQVADALKRAAAELFCHYGFSCATELGVETWGNRRADVIGCKIDGTVVIVEVKSSLADFSADDKWHLYLQHCDRLYFMFSEKLWLKFKARPELMSRLGDQVGVITVPVNTGYARIVRPCKKDRMADAERINILARLGWRAGDISKRTTRARQRIFIND